MRTLILLAAAVLGVAGSSYIGSGTAALGRAEFTATLVSVKFLDIGPRSTSVGDTSIRKWRITDRDGTAQGFGHEVCRWTSGILRLCSGAYDLSTGTVTYGGLVGDGSPLAITGGTDGYIGASGQLTRLGRTVRFLFE